MNRFPIIVSSPSGGGKTTIVAALLKRDKSLQRVITATTRAPRKGEKDKKDYYFWTEEQFKDAIKNKQMAEWAKVHTDYYGVPKCSFEDAVKKGKYPVLVIDVQGAKTVRKTYKEALTVFVAPPSLKVLKERIAARGDGTKNISVRMATAKKEMTQLKDYDYVIINDKLPDAIDDLAAIIRAQRLKTETKAKFLKK